ncbi:MAG TPA: cytochrome c oxidase assembly factor Coa1 family protein [Pyrinomonadaceae bacterium]|nr:cytochrome c oxidase assembly factor Coa1 family protein [Pyrinomonadaceae bacterium]
MTTKKIVIVVISIVVGLGLIVTIFAVGIVGIALYKIGNSEAAETARTFLRNNERLKQDIGEVKDFGSLVTGNIDIKNRDGNATINIKVIGEREEVNASVDLAYRDGQPWRVTGASYKNDAGQTVELFNPYEGRKRVPKLAA